MKKEVMHKSEQLYNLLLRLYPEKFKRQFGDEMKFVFSESLRDAYEQDGSKGIFVLWGWTFFDLFTSLFNEHVQDRQEDPSMNQKYSLFAGPGNGVLQQPSARRQEYELRTDNELVGTLHWPKALRSLCVAETADGSWTFKRQGFFNLRVTARVAGSEQDLLIYRPNWTGMNGTMEHSDGREFKLRGSNLWCNRFALVQKPAQGDDVELLTVKINFYIVRGSADLAIQPKLAQTEDAALLAMFGCYLALMVYEDLSGMS